MISGVVLRKNDSHQSLAREYGIGDLGKHIRELVFQNSMQFYNSNVAIGIDSRLKTSNASNTDHQNVNKKS